jgi:CRP-like cAMP-binding protein
MVTPESTGAGEPGEVPVSLPLLREVALFGGLPDDVLESFAATLATRHVAAGTVVFEEGEKASSLYVLLAGEAEVMKHSKSGREHRVALLGPMDTFGEMSMIDVQPRSATVRAVAPARIMRIRSEDIDRLYRQDMKSYALLILNIARDLSRRLRVADGILADVAGTVIDRYAGARG